MKATLAAVLVLVLAAVLSGCGDINLGWGNRNGDNNSTKTDSHDSTVNGNTNAASTNAHARLIGVELPYAERTNRMRGIAFLEGGA